MKHGGHHFGEAGGEWVENVVISELPDYNVLAEWDILRTPTKWHVQSKVNLGEFGDDWEAIIDGTNDSEHWPTYAGEGDSVYFRMRAEDGIGTPLSDWYLSNELVLGP
jgi:hypothetical protein